MDDLQLELEAFTKAARGTTEAELSKSGRPDFSGVWAELQAREAADIEGDDPELFEWVAAARAEVQKDLDTASRRPVPPLPHANTSDQSGEPKRAGALWWAGWLAAAFALFFGAQWALRANRVAPEAVHQAEREAKSRDDGGEALTRPVEIPEVEAAPLPEPVAPIAPLDLEPTEPAQSEKKADRAKTRPRRSRKDQLRELDREAQALWRAGDLDGAEELFEKIVTKGGKSSLADVAYGDLLTLARQRGRQARELELWRDYLRVFPRGRHADDASAGLCRRGPRSNAANCWTEYLERFPQGAHRRAADKALVAESPVDEVTP